ncbi:MAG: glycogen debranching enzyme N-terminal domain-containing protein [Bacteroidetes bacterium]|uniref:Glycogen debranching enzyme N-terminal domain-containing protein n=1 Tax=Candidatus Cryptobacteroides gallistercoris TaxID=2840765 RepID=A0A940IFV2_9BACT|nr:glycogen debranching enzyme N-terminal domain-containing protein [Candidatus Cryptobacteroides gallistercoris]
MAFLKFNKSELVNLEYSLKREILSASKTGAYCNTSIVACNTRRYHGLLAVPVDNLGGGKYVLLSALDESLVMNGRQFNLGIHCYGDVYEPRGHKYIIDFDADPEPKITYKVGEILFTKTILMAPDSDQVLIRYDLLAAPSKTTLILKPFLAFRSVHSLTHQNPEADTQYRDVDGGVSFRLYDGFPELNLQLSAKAPFKYMPYWYNGITYSDELRRGFECKEDLFVPGTFVTELKPGDSIVFSASVNTENPKQLKRKFTDTVRKHSEIRGYHDLLVHDADLLKCTRNGHERINAGFSWLETGLLRETIESLPGLTLYAGDKGKEFEEILDNLVAEEQDRLLRRTTQVEAPLRLTDTIQQYIHYSGEEKRIWEKYGKLLKNIIDSYAPGKRNEITMHPNGLLWAQMDRVALSWMNAYVDGYPVTERAGYQVETNAFWYNALCFALDMEQKYGAKKSAFAARWSHVRELVAQNFQPAFWNPEAGYLADYVDNGGQNMDVRPNQLFAVCLDYSPVDDEVKAAVISVINNELVTSRGIRTLSPRNPKYRGVYEGSQRDRDLAYHQGCAFPSLLGPYIDCCFKVMLGSSFYKKAEYLTEGFYADINKHGVGAFSELYDGDPPHEAHGAISSACSTAALLRVDYLMKKYKEVKK